MCVALASGEKNILVNISIDTYIYIHTVDGRNPAPVDMINVPLFIICKVLYIPGGAGFLPSTVCIYIYICPQISRYM